VFETTDIRQYVSIRKQRGIEFITDDIKELDHAATRVRAEDRDAAVIELMNLTNYSSDFAIYVKVFNSITNVARFSSKDFAMVD
jgi:hypothetical protein